jgi:hypothetical protein
MRNQSVGLECTAFYTHTAGHDGNISVAPLIKQSIKKLKF